MVVEELSDADETAVTSLWAEAGFTRPWNDSASDFAGRSADRLHACLVYVTETNS